MSEWKPIATAPQDGTQVLLGRFTGRRGASHEGHICVDWWRKPEDQAGYVGFGFFNPQQWPATHWMPLPKPPKVSPTSPDVRTHADGGEG